MAFPGAPPLPGLRPPLVTVDPLPAAARRLCQRPEWHNWAMLKTTRLPDGRILDPPDLAKYAARVDPPMERWPGRPLGREDIAAACGDPRDWFKFGHRELAAEIAWAEFADAQARRKSLFPGFSWNQVLIIGEFGAGKTALATFIARHFFGLGHPVFSNAGLLFGWRVSRTGIYTMLSRSPRCAVIVVDESSAALSSRMSAGVSVDSFVQNNLNVRKLNILIIYVSAQDTEISASIRRDCREVWMPLGGDQMEVETAGDRLVISNDGTVKESDRPAHSNPANDTENFHLAWHVWDDYPYKRSNIIEGPDKSKDGFGAPAHTTYAGGEEVRRAFLLTDSFELAQSGAARNADPDEVKAESQKFLDENFGSEKVTAGLYQEHGPALLQYIDSRRREKNPPKYFQAPDIGAALGVTAVKAGLILRHYFRDVEKVQRYGYSAQSIYDYLSTFDAPAG